MPWIEKGMTKFVDRISEFSDARRLWLSKELIHYHLFGTDGYTERNTAREDARAKLEAEAEEKKVGSGLELLHFV